MEKIEEQKFSSKNPQIVHGVCVPLLCSFLQGGSSFDSLGIEIQNLLRQSASELSKSISEAAVIDVTDQYMGMPMKSPTKPHMSNVPQEQVKKPCAGCK